MASISIWQLIILVAIVSVPIAAFFLIRKGQTNDITRPLRVMDWSFWLGLLGVVLVYGYFAASHDPAAPRSETPTWTNAAILVLAWLWWIFVIALGILAARLSRRWIVWVGIVIIIPLIGEILGYALLRGHARRALDGGNDDDSRG